MSATESDFPTDAGVAELFHVSVRTLQRWVKDSDFPKALQLGRCRRWDRAEVVAYLRSRMATKDRKDLPGKKILAVCR
jgi:predicted DNA-binding transcriptional regulator AlpA